MKKQEKIVISEVKLDWLKKANKRIDSTWFQQPRLKHSKKPDFFQNMIVEVFGDLPRIELFARQETPGWDVWGNEVNIPKRPRLK